MSDPAPSPLRFRPPLWSVAGLIPLLALLIWLGFWQYRSGIAKQQIEQNFAVALKAPAAPLLLGTPAPAAGELRRVWLSGHYLAHGGVLLDNQSRGQRPGVDVWTPFVLEDGSVAVVDRGWLPLVNGALPVASAPPAGAQRIEGYWRRRPEPGMRLGVAACQPGAARPAVVNYPGAEEFRCLFGAGVLDGLLLLAPEAPGGYTRDWRPQAEGIPPARHFGYALQWWLFAAVLIFFFIKLNLHHADSG